MRMGWGDMSLKNGIYNERRAIGVDPIYNAGMQSLPGIPFALRQ
jgi:hypothetical protein